VDHGREAALTFVAVIRGLATRALEAMTTADVRPTSWEEILETAHALHELISPEAIAALTNAVEPAPLVEARVVGRVG
jgi:hypothetical protein